MNRAEQDAEADGFAARLALVGMGLEESVLIDETLVRQIVSADVSIQLQALQNQIQGILQRVRLGLAAVQEPTDTARLAFPELAFELTMATWESVPSKADIRNFRTWILGNGFRELIERVHLHLDWAASFCRALSLQAEHGFASISAVHEKDVDEYWARVHRMGFKPKIDHLQKEYDLTTNLDQAVLSAQKARNCLTHRAGVVSEEFDCQEGPLRMVWIGSMIERYTGESEPKLLEEPGDIGRGGVYAIGSKTRRRAFEAGSVIQLDSREFNDIAVTCYFYCREITKAAVGYGRDRLGLRETVPPLGDDWSRETAMHLYLNVPDDDAKRTSAVVVDWNDGRLRPVGVRDMTRESIESVPSGEARHESTAPDHSDEESSGRNGSQLREE